MSQITVEKPIPPCSFSKRVNCLSSFLGVKYAPFCITSPNQPPDNLATPAAKRITNKRVQGWMQ